MIDRYARAILTVIALALVALVIQNALPRAEAAGGVQKVAICDYQVHARCARVAGGSLYVD